MSNLIEVNPNNSAIKFFSVGNVRFVAYDNLNAYKIVFRSCESCVHISQSNFVKPDELEHSVSVWGSNTTDLFPVLSSAQLDLTVSFHSFDAYLQVCELFNMIPDFEVVRSCARSSLDDLGAE
ncbi:hypothetical protein [Vibrio sp. PID23_8]|uniref:hypothetical protein n=1 Tax=Vibrio sp. PID23_8 TaxID=1583767 RepID=UPI000E68DD6E|nr:hypothetical protein [Vibrio sp. PID23_8]RIZ55159.1 hypothetical protein AK966_07445 [Vibrio sp. PID23_8]